MITTLNGVDEATLAEIKAEMKVRQTSEVFVLFPLGSQFDHLIKLALDRMGVYCLLADPATVTVDDIATLGPTGLILSGGPASVYEEAPHFDTGIFDLGIPTLGICLGFQLWAQYRGCAVSGAAKREFGVHSLMISRPESRLWRGINVVTPVLQSHGDYIEPGAEMEILATSLHTPVAAGRLEHLWGVQFHPEVTASLEGYWMLHNFCFEICGARDVFPAGDEAEQKIAQLRAQVGEATVLLALSGGSDSSVVAELLLRAVPNQIEAVYIRGIDRPDDEAFVDRFFAGRPGILVHYLDATNEFLTVLAGRTKMHDKRVAMRGVYRSVLERQAAAVGAGFIAQGTLYTDLSESGGGHTTGARKAQIKLHHNTDLRFTLPELTPLDDCVKDTARAIGRSLGVAEELLVRHPFPGPGLVVRIEGEVTAESLHIARAADGIYIEELRAAELYESVWQAGAVVTRSEHTYTKGDDAGSGHVVTLWAVWSVNGFTAEWAELPHDFLRRVAQRLTNEIPEVAAVTYRISDKPPATIEWG